MSDLHLEQPNRFYLPESETYRNAEIERADRNNVKRWDLPEWVLDPGFLQSPDGTRWKLVVDNSGALTTEAL